MILNLVVGAILSTFIPIIIVGALVLAGIFSSYLLLTNFIIALVLFVVIILITINALTRNYIISAAFLTSLTTIVAVFYFVGEDGLRKSFYTSDILFNPKYNNLCLPNNGLPVNGMLVSICRKYDFNYAGFIEVVIRIDGNGNRDGLLKDIYLGNIEPRASKQTLANLGDIWVHKFSFSQLCGKYYLLTIEI